MSSDESDDTDFEIICATIGCKNARDWCNEYCNDCNTRKKNRLLQKASRQCSTFGCENEADIKDLSLACYQLNNESVYESMNDGNSDNEYEEIKDNIYETIDFQDIISARPYIGKTPLEFPLNDGASTEQTRPSKLETPSKASEANKMKSRSIVATNELEDDATCDTVLTELDFKLDTDDTAGTYKLLADTTVLTSSQRKKMCTSSGCTRSVINKENCCQFHSGKSDKASRNSDTLVPCVIPGCTNTRSRELLICESCIDEQEEEKISNYFLGNTNPPQHGNPQNHSPQFNHIYPYCRTPNCNNALTNDMNSLCYECIENEKSFGQPAKKCPLCENTIFRVDGFCTDCFQSQIAENQGYELLRTNDLTAEAVINPTMLCVDEGCTQRTRSTADLICLVCSKQQQDALKAFERQSSLHPPQLPPSRRSTSAPSLSFIGAVSTSNVENNGLASTLNAEISATHQVNNSAPALTVNGLLSVSSTLENRDPVANGLVRTTTAVDLMDFTNEELRSTTEPVKGGIFNSSNFLGMGLNFNTLSQYVSIEESRSSPLPGSNNCLEVLYPTNLEIDIRKSETLPRTKNTMNLMNPATPDSSKNRSNSTPCLNLQDVANQLPPIPTQASAHPSVNRTSEVVARGYTTNATNQSIGYTNPCLRVTTEHRVTPEEPLAIKLNEYYNYGPVVDTNQRVKLNENTRYVTPVTITGGVNSNSRPPTTFTNSLFRSPSLDNNYGPEWSILPLNHPSLTLKEPIYQSSIKTSRNEEHQFRNKSIKCITKSCDNLVINEDSSTSEYCSNCSSFLRQQSSIPSIRTMPTSTPMIECLSTQLITSARLQQRQLTSSQAVPLPSRTLGSLSPINSNPLIPGRCFTIQTLRAPDIPPRIPKPPSLSVSIHPTQPQPRFRPASLPSHHQQSLLYASHFLNRGAPPPIPTPPAVTVTTLPSPPHPLALRSLSVPSIPSTPSTPSPSPSQQICNNKLNFLPQSLPFYSMEEEMPIVNQRTSSPPIPLQLQRGNVEDFEDFEEGGCDVLSNRFNNEVCKQTGCQFFGSDVFERLCSSCYKKDLAKKSAEQLALSQGRRLSLIIFISYTKWNQRKVEVNTVKTLFKTGIEMTRINWN